MPQKEWIKVVYNDGNIFVYDGVCVFRHALCHRPEGLEDLYLIRRHFIFWAAYTRHLMRCLVVKLSKGHKYSE
jgi:hypothetical protein